LPVTSLAHPATTFHGEGDQNQHDSNAADDVRHHGNRTGHVAGVRPDETDDRPDDEQSDNRGEPEEKPPVW